MNAETFPGWSTDTLDDRIVNPHVYTEPGTLLADYATLRATDPVHWTEPKGYRPFWAITSHAEITAVSKSNTLFINRERTYPSPIEGENWVRSMTGDSHLFRTLVDLDDPDHRKLRQITHSWFQPGTVKKNLEPKVREIAREHIDMMRNKGETMDFVNEVALFYPLRVIMEILGVPREDEPLMLKLTQETFGALDPDVIARSQRITAGNNLWGSSGGSHSEKETAGIVKSPAAMREERSVGDMGDSFQSERREAVQLNVGDAPVRFSRLHKAVRS